MADIRNFAAHIRGRWDWTAFGYEEAFPRNSQFGDIDAVVEFDGRWLIVEPKHHDGIGPCPYPPNGQLRLLRAEVSLGKSVVILYGCGVCNSPQAVRILGHDRKSDRWEDWRDLGIEESRKRLRQEIDRAMGLG